MPKEPEQSLWSKLWASNGGPGASQSEAQAKLGLSTVRDQGVTRGRRSPTCDLNSFTRAELDAMQRIRPF